MGGCTFLDFLHTRTGQEQAERLSYMQRRLSWSFLSFYPQVWHDSIPLEPDSRNGLKRETRQKMSGRTILYNSSVDPWKRAGEEERSNPPVTVKRSISWKTSVLVKKRLHRLFHRPDHCSGGSSWSLHSCVTLLKRAWKRHRHAVSRTRSSSSEQRDCVIDFIKSHRVPALLKMINDVPHWGSRQPCTRGDWYVDCLACSVTSFLSPPVMIDGARWPRSASWCLTSTESVRGKEINASS